MRVNNCQSGQFPDSGEMAHISPRGDRAMRMRFWGGSSARPRKIRATRWSRNFLGHLVRSLPQRVPPQSPVAFPYHHAWWFWPTLMDSPQPSGMIFEIKRQHACVAARALAIRTLSRYSLNTVGVTFSTPRYLPCGAGLPDS